MGRLRAWHDIPGAVPRTAPFFRKLDRLVFRSGSVSMANFADRLAEVYEDRTVLFLEGSSSLADGRCLSYRDVAGLVGRLSAVLAAQGVQRGDRVVLFCRNGVETPLLSYAAMRIGAIAIPVNPMYRASEIRYILEHSHAAAVVSDASTRGEIEAQRAALPFVRAWLDLEPDVPAPFKPLPSLLAEAPPVPPPAALAEDDPVGIFYTSGTTGQPKGAVLTNKGFLFHLRRSFRLSTLIPKRNIHASVHALPVTHIMGYLVFLAFLASGSPIVFLPAFDAARVIEVISRYGVTVFVGVPAMYGMILRDSIPGGVLQTIRVFVSAADVLPPQWAEEIRLRARRRYLWFFRRRPMFAEFYGQVETTGVTCVKLSLPFMRYDVGCVGRPMPGVEVKIADAQGREVKKGEVGEVVVKGDNILKGYWGREDREGVFTPDGWFRTGDLAKRGSLGFFYFVDREKDMIKSGGYSIFTREVEDLLMRHPGVAEAAVFGLPHEVKKEIPVAAVILKPGAEVTPDALVEWAKAQMAPYKAPRRVFFVDDLPRGSTHKVLKKELKQRYLAEASEAGRPA